MTSHDLRHQKNPINKILLSKKTPFQLKIQHKVAMFSLFYGNLTCSSAQSAIFHSTEKARMYDNSKISL